jgi:hypothetical protein
MKCTAHCTADSAADDLVNGPMICILSDIPRDLLFEIMAMADGRDALNLARTSRDWWTQYPELLAAAGFTLARGEHESIQKPIPNTLYHGITRTNLCIWSMYEFGELTESLRVDRHVPWHDVRRYYTIQGHQFLLKYSITDRGVVQRSSKVSWSWNGRHGVSPCVISLYDDRGQLKIERRFYCPIAYPISFIKEQLMIPSYLTVLYTQGALPSR